MQADRFYFFARKIQLSGEIRELLEPNLVDTELPFCLSILLFGFGANFLPFFFLLWATPWFGCCPKGASVTVQARGVCEGERMGFWRNSGTQLLEQINSRIVLTSVLSGHHQKA